jgi:hypothetical protein
MAGGAWRLHSCYVGASDAWVGARFVASAPVATKRKALYFHHIFLYAISRGFRSRSLQFGKSRKIRI